MSTIKELLEEYKESVGEIFTSEYASAYKPVEGRSGWEAFCDKIKTATDSAGTLVRGGVLTLISKDQMKANNEKLAHFLEYMGEEDFALAVLARETLADKVVDTDRRLAMSTLYSIVASPFVPKTFEEAAAFYKDFSKEVQVEIRTFFDRAIGYGKP